MWSVAETGVRPPRSVSTGRHQKLEEARRDPALPEPSEGAWLRPHWAFGLWHPQLGDTKLLLSYAPSACGQLLWKPWETQWGQMPCPASYQGGPERK